MYQRDLLQRQLELFRQALARLVARRQQGELELAREEARQAYDALGIDASFLALDAATLVSLVSSRDKLAALCELFDEEARVELARAGAKRAASLAARARELRQAAGLAPPPRPPRA
ncbi:MAG: hypothetical protein IT373_27650 [Polyangiaceae bacterium]|nr:hypothetical protein [Polyangiaceae bacterium]